MIPIEQFGQDHWSTLAYVETRVVDSGGLIDHRRMRCSNARHPLLAHLPAVVGVDEHGRQKYPTRLKGGATRYNHDDWDCLDDLEAAGLLVQGGTGLYRSAQLTDAGFQMAARLRQWRAQSGQHANSYGTFSMGLPVAPCVEVRQAESTRSTGT